jgi:uncharacterized protein
MANTVAVSGSGRASGSPDLLVVDFGVSVLRSTVGQASADASRLAETMIDQLIAGGIARPDIQTTNYSIQPEYDYSGRVQRMVGYRVSNSVAARMRDLERAGAVISAVTDSAGDSVVVNGVRFEIEDRAALVEQARRAAWEDVYPKAEQLAALAGVNLGAAVSIAEVDPSRPPPVMFARRAMATDMAESSVPLEGGELEVSVAISVEFSLG